MLKVVSQFWSGVLVSWCEYHYEVPTEPEEMANQVIWYNSNVRSRNRVLFNKHMYEKGIVYVKDLFLRGKLMTFQEAKYIYDLSEEWWLEFATLISAIPQEWKSPHVCQLADSEKVCKILYLDRWSKWSQIIYKHMNITDVFIQQCTVKLADKWQLSLDGEQMKKTFENVRQVTDITKYRAFQYRLLNNVIFLNDRLVHLALSREDKCCQCMLEKETVQHFLFTVTPRERFTIS